MDARLQRRVQRYGWDLAAVDYEPLWGPQLAEAQSQLLEQAALQPGETVLDIACGTGIVSFAAARAVGENGQVIGTDLSGQMIDAAQRQAAKTGYQHLRFARMDAEALDLADASVDVVLCALGLMYVPDPARALAEMRRVLHPGGRIVIAVWGERKHCGWASLFSIVDAEVSSEVCPLFFHLGQGEALARLCQAASFDVTKQHRLRTTLDYADGDAACDAAFVGGPVALAWSRFDAATRARTRASYLASISPWQHASGYRVPGEFVILSAKISSSS
jgi:ubiquinone/menaquinone biosynthesis C-methylase UbiE